MQVLSLTNDQIHALPAGERDAILALVCNLYFVQTSAHSSTEKSIHARLLNQEVEGSLSVLVVMQPVW